MCIARSPAPTGRYSAAPISYTGRRLCLYIVLLNFRGWILYVLLNELEDRFVSSSSVGQTTCWYNIGWLLPEQEACIGKAFDFSDHVVLYYAQILPIALVETLYAFQSPYWVSEHRIPNLVFPIVLVASYVYLQFIATLGAYKTTAFFHTPGEVIAGFLVSFVVTVPLYLLQCSSRWATWRSLFFRSF